jgi:hypothetical protein
MAQEARYIYSIAKMGTRVSMGEIGIEKTEVFTIPYKDIAAVVHSCQPMAYDTKERERAEEWVLAHSYVIDHAMKMFGSVLPFSFDVILKGDDSAILEWLSKNYSLLYQDLENVKGKAEYTIQVYYDYDDLASRILKSDAKLMELKCQIERECKGKAYLLGKKLDQKLKALVSIEAASLLDKSLTDIKSQVDDLKMDGKRWTPDNYKGLSLLASYTCLVRDDAAARLGETLDEINCMEGFRVRFTGPWPAFSFVNCKELS